MAMDAQQHEVVHVTHADHQAPGLVDRIVKQLVERVTDARVEVWPFQHFYMTNIFPDDIYAQIVANLPGKACYLPLNAKRWKNSQGESTRDRLCLTEGELGRIDSSRRPFWVAITEALQSDNFRRAVYGKLAGDVAIRLGCAQGAVLEQPAYPNIMLIRDYQDYRIKPHPDGQPRVVTMQFYLPGKEGQDDLGTSLYIRQPFAHRLIGRTFKEIKRFPFKPNSAYALAVNDCAARQSYHGRELITACETTRDSILLTWNSRNIAQGQKHRSAA
jgi:hypothetical protein